MLPTHPPIVGNSLLDSEKLVKAQPLRAPPALALASSLVTTPLRWDAAAVTERPMRNSIAPHQTVAALE